MKTNDVESSLEKFQEAFGLFENDENALEYLVETLYSIGICYTMRNKKDKALAIFEEAYSICKEDFNNYDSKLADLLIEMAKIRGESNENQKALEYYKEVCTISRNIFYLLIFIYILGILGATY